jgi:hypothetical protein
VGAVRAVLDPQKPDLDRAVAIVLAVELAAIAVEAPTTGMAGSGSPFRSNRSGHATGQLLGLGTDVEVLGPPELRDRIHQTALAVAVWYGGGGTDVPSVP